MRAFVWIFLSLFHSCSLSVFMQQIWLVSFYLQITRPKEFICFCCNKLTGVISVRDEKRKRAERLIPIWLVWNEDTWYGVLFISVKHLFDSGKLYFTGISRSKWRKQINWDALQMADTKESFGICSQPLAQWQRHWYVYILHAFE